MLIDGIRMKSVRHRHFKLPDLLRPAFSHRAGFLFKPLAFDPQTSLKDCRNFRFVLLCKRQQIPQMVAVRVRQENYIHTRHVFQRSRARRIRHHPWIDERHLPRRRRHRKRAMSKICDSIALRVEHSPVSLFFL
jgi:hypothetical protein